MSLTAEIALSVLALIAMWLLMAAVIGALAGLMRIWDRVAAIRHRQKQEQSGAFHLAAPRQDEDEIRRQPRRSRLRLGHRAALELLADDEVAKLKEQAGSILKQLADADALFRAGRDPEALLALGYVLENIRRRLGSGKHWLEAIVLRDLARQAHFENRIADRDRCFAQAAPIVALWTPYYPWLQAMCSPRCLIRGLPKA